MNKNFSIKFLTIAMFCLLLGVAQIFAQSTVSGGIRGKVTDPQNAVVPNASVKVINAGTNQSTDVTANEDGVFVVNNLQPGVYSIEISATGFSAYKVERATVEVGQFTTVDANLSVGVATATVDITADAPVINTNDNSNSTNINQTTINEAPSNGRRASNFVILTPATVPDGTFGLISFRGISGLLNNSTVDGGDNNQAFFSEERGRTRINYSISQSAVREFQVNGSNYSAEYGRAAGGVVNTVTKSGTNGFHGDLFYYNRNNRNGARNPRAFGSAIINGVPTPTPAKPIDLREQFGGTIGGPIVKDRLFFFFSYDQQKRNFPGLAAFTNPGYLNTLNTASLTSRGVTAAQVDGSVAFINSLTGETPRKGDQKLFLPKIDWQITQNNLFTATYNRLRWDSPAGIQTQAVNNLGRASFGDDFVDIDTVNLRLQSTFSSNLLNEIRVQYSRDLEYQNSQDPLPGEPLTATTSQGTRAPNVSLTNGLAFGTPTFLERGKYPDERRIQFADTVTLTTGRHTFKFGGDFNHVTDDTENLRFQAGSYAYSTINDFIFDYVNYLNPGQIPAATLCPGSTRAVGRCYNGNFSIGLGTPGLKISTNDINLFAQDDYRITPRLTVNLGIRYELQQLPDPVLANSGPYSSTLIPNVGRTFAEATSYMPDDNNNFGPRFGFAYDVFGDGKTSLRGGYGVYYGRMINSTIYNALINTGNPNGQFQVNAASTTTTNCFPLVPTSTQLCAPLFPVVPVVSAAFLNNATTPIGAIQFFRKGFQAPLIHQYDMILERQIAKNTVVSVSYLGSLGRNLPTFVDVNFSPTPTAIRTIAINGGPFSGQTFTFPQYSRAFGGQAITEIQSSVRSQYNALVFQANRRFTNGLQFQASYTLAKSTDTNQNSATFTQNNSPLSVFDRSFDAGPSTNDVRHKVIVSAVWAPTFYKGGSNTFYNYILNGWSISPIYAFYSGRPYDITVSATNALNGTNGDTRLPIAARNAFRLPNVSNLDVRVSKRFKFNERFNLELLAEGFNVFNSTHAFGVNTLGYTLITANIAANGTAVGNCAPGTNLPAGSNGLLCFNQNNGVTNFQQITGTDSTLYRERQIQFAIRFQY